MAALTKRQKALKPKVDRAKNYPLTDALALAKDTATAKFNESIDVAVMLGVDRRVPVGLLGLAAGGHSGGRSLASTGPR